MTRLIDVDALHLVCNVYDSDAKRIIWEINHAPTIDAVPVRHGAWQKVGHIDSTWLVYKCSVCNGQTIDGGNYCPNCGARMDEE